MTEQFTPLSEEYKLPEYKTLHKNTKPVLYGMLVLVTLIVIFGLVKIISARKIPASKTIREVAKISALPEPTSSQMTYIRPTHRVNLVTVLPTILAVPSLTHTPTLNPTSPAIRPVFTAAPAKMVMGGTFLGEYFRDNSAQQEHLLAANSIFKRNDTTINFKWKDSSPGIGLNKDFYSIRWTNKIYLFAGDHLFKTAHDDGERVYIRRVLVYDKWNDQPAAERTFIVNVAVTGWYDLVVEYYQSTGNAEVSLSWN